MKKILLFLLLIITFNLYSQAKLPKIFATKPDHNFGEIFEGQIVNHSFEIVNNGTADLKIDKVQASCGCTAAQPAKKILKPGEKTTIRVEFDSANRMGVQQKYVYVFSNDQSAPQLRLSFTAIIVDKISNPDGKGPKLNLNTNQFDFGNVEEGKIYDTKITFSNKGNDLLEIRDVKSSCGCTAAMLSSKKLQPGESGTIRIELDTANRLGKLTRTVTLITNDPSEPNRTITLFANIEKRKS